MAIEQLLAVRDLWASWTEASTTNPDQTREEARDGVEQQWGGLTTEPGGVDYLEIEVAVADWLPALARELGAKKPMRVLRWVGRLLAGKAGVVMMTELGGASSAKAKRKLGWRPAHASWRQGFLAV